MPHTYIKEVTIVALEIQAAMFVFGIRYPAQNSGKPPWVATCI